MGKFLSEKERKDLDQQIADVEKATGTQIVLASVKRCDSYAELPWKAFAFGASIAGLVVFVLGIVNAMPLSLAGILLCIISLLGAGAVFALLTVICHAFARLFLSGSHAETEVKQFAESTFLSHEMFVTEARCAILILTGMFERQSVIVADKGAAERIGEDAQNYITKKMEGLFRKKKLYDAMTAGLSELKEVLGKSKNKGSGKDELPNEIIEEKGI